MSARPGAKSLWGGRFEAGPAAELDRLNHSLPVDHRLWREDLAGSRAWATALHGCGVLTPAESQAIEGGLDAVAVRLAGWTSEDWASAPDEDIHTLIERLLGEEVGPVAGKLATGRSRNDQVATSTRLWAQRAAERLDAELARLQSALVDQAERHVETLMPGYTHGQRAQPITAGHWLLSHFWPLDRDRARLAEARHRVGTLPLGSGAVGGCPYPVDRSALVQALGFEAVTPNSLDAVGDRDFVAELLFVIALTGSHLSRLAEDVIVFSSTEYGLVRLADAWSTGSSLMPQKRNPDPLELARGKAGALIGGLVGWLVTLKGLPSGYSKDLQEDKAALFGAFDTLSMVLPALAGTVRALELDRQACAAAIDESMLTTDLADALVGEGVPFREAHELVGRLIRQSERLACAVRDLPPTVAREISPAFELIDRGRVFDPTAAVGRRSSEGGTAPSAVRDQIRLARSRL